MSEEHRIFLGLGSNIGDRCQNLQKATHQLNNHPHIWVIKQSYVYQSPAMYQTDQDDFCNISQCSDLIFLLGPPGVSWSPKHEMLLDL